MNGNIQVEPIRVKLDKQGATSLKEEKTVDAIVRLLLTKLRPTQVTQVSQYLMYPAWVLFLCNLKVFEKFWEWVSGPPLFEPFPVLPPPPTMSESASDGGMKCGVTTTFTL